MPTKLPSALRFLGFSEAVSAGIVTSGAVAASAIYVIGVFSALPLMMQRRIEFIDSVEGFLMNAQDARKRTFQISKNQKFDGPLEYDDLDFAGSPLARMFGESTVDRDDVIAIISAQLDTQEGKKLYGKLISTNEWSMPGIFGSHDLGAKWRGPIIGNSISSRILKSRKEMADKANKKLSREISNRIDELKAANDHDSIIQFAKDLGWDSSQVK
jgi:hypothetical protein